MARSSFGFAVNLNPVWTVNGTDYGILVYFYDYPTLGSGPEIVSGRVVSVSDLGNGRKKIVCARGYRYFDLTHVEDQGNSWEETIPVLCGGNIVSSPEPTHVPLSYLNQDAHTGPDTTNRAQIGDVLKWDNKRFLIERVSPFTEAPSEVTWQGENLDRVSRIFCGSYYESGEWCYAGIEFDQSGTDFIVEDDGSGLFDVGLVWEDTGVESGNMSKKTWEGADDYLPQDAVLGFAEYWIDYIYGRILFPSTQATRAGDGKKWNTVDKITITWYDSGLDEYSFSGSDVGVFQGAGTGLSGNFATCLSRIEKPDPFSAHEQVLTIEAVDGEGAGLIWIEDYSSGSPFVALQLDSDGDIFCTYRTARDGDISTNNVPGEHNPTVYFRLKETAAGTIVPSWKGGGGWNDLSSISLEFPVVFFGGVWAQSNAGIRFGFDSSWDLESHWFGSEATGTLSIKMEDEQEPPWEDGAGVKHWYWGHAKTDDTIGSVYNETADCTMTEVEDASSLQRDAYIVVDGVIYFGCESFGDKIRITYTGGESPSSPGQEPPGGPINFSNGDGALEHNRGNWYDVIIVYDIDDLTANMVEGDSFTIYRNGVADPRDPFDLYYCPKEGSFSQIPDGHLYKNPLAGCFLISQEWRSANLSSGTKYCFESHLSKLLKLNAFNARQLNDVDKALKVSNTMEVSILPGGMGFYAIGEMRAGPGNKRCVGNGQTEDTKENFCWGIPYNFVEKYTLLNRVQNYGKTNTWSYRPANFFGQDSPGPATMTPNGWMGTVKDDAVYLYHLLGSPAVCQRSDSYYVSCETNGNGFSGSVPPSGAENPDEHCADESCDIGACHKGDEIDESNMEVFFSDTSISPSNVMGIRHPAWAAYYDRTKLTPCLDVNAVGFNPGPKMRRILGGAAVNWAKMEFDFSGGQYGNLSHYSEIDAGTKTRKTYWSHDGTNWTELGVGENLGFSLQDGVSEYFTFGLMAARLDSRKKITCPAKGDYIPYGNQYAYIGQGLSFGGNDQHGIVDVTDAVQAMLDNLDSGYRYFYWLPMVASGLQIAMGENATGDFLKGLLPTHSCTTGTQNDDPQDTVALPRVGIDPDTGEGTPMVWMTWSSFSIVRVIINVTLAGGEEQVYRIPYTGNALISA